MKKISLVIILLLTTTVLLSGCTSSIQLTKENLSSIQTIAINNEVKIPNKLDYFGPGHATEAIFSAFGVIVSASGRDDSVQTMLSNYIKRNKIYIDEIVLNEFRRQIKKHPKFVGKKFTNKGVDAMFVIEVESYGLYQDNNTFLLNSYKPGMVLIIKLISTKQEILWEQREYLFNADSKHLFRRGKTINDYLKSPKVLRDTYNKAAFYVVSSILKTL